MPSFFVVDEDRNVGQRPAVAELGVQRHPAAGILPLAQNTGFEHTFRVVRVHFCCVFYFCSFFVFSTEKFLKSEIYVQNEKAETTKQIKKEENVWWNKR